MNKENAETSHKTLKERLEGFRREYAFEEWDTGNPVGKERDFEVADIISGFVEIEN